MTYVNDAGQLGIVFKALSVAAEKHRDQRRKNLEASPYINHPIALANVLYNEGGVADVDVICAAILHDTIEDTDMSANELESLFGKTICQLVIEVTDDKSLPKDVRKDHQITHARQSSHKAKLVKLADKICNLRDLAEFPPVGWTIDRRRKYFIWARSVVDQIRGTHEILESLFDESFAGGMRSLNYLESN